MSEQEYAAAVIAETRRLQREHGYGWSKAMAIAADSIKRDQQPQQATKEAK